MIQNQSFHFGDWKNPGTNKLSDLALLLMKRRKVLDIQALSSHSPFTYSANLNSMLYLSQISRLQSILLDTLGVTWQREALIHDSKSGQQDHFLLLEEEGPYDLEMPQRVFSSGKLEEETMQPFSLATEKSLEDGEIELGRRYAKQLSTLVAMIA